jgi:3-methyladenine DNA glycosylase AlkC
MNLKEVYDHKFLETLADTLAKADQKFSKQKFLKNFPEKIWATKELKERMRAISLILEESLSPKNFLQKIEILKRVAVAMPKDKMSGLALIIFPDFVEVFGLEYFDESMDALEFFTEFGSSEFAVRQFIKLDQKRALEFFKKWSKSKNYHVRRLSSEGCRPRLPWGCVLEEFKKNPAEILPILENLKNDEAEYVRKSVANNLNDISKDNPHLVLDLLRRWKKDEVRKNLIKHALRTLLKKGDKTALALIDVDCNNLSEKILIENFSLQKESVEISTDLMFDFSLQNQVSGKKIRLEYAVYFLKQNGTHTKKIFQITTKNFAKGLFSFSKKHSFRDLSTRKHYAGKHLISLVVNGLEAEKKEFDLISPL